MSIGLQVSGAIYAFNPFESPSSAFLLCGGEGHEQFQNFLVLRFLETQSRPLLVLLFRHFPLVILPWLLVV